MQNEEEKRRLEEDRRHLLYRLERLGYVPDEDMRETLSEIRAMLQKRIKGDG